MKDIVKGYCYVILSAVIFGCSPLAAKFVYSEGLNPFMLTFFRNALALPVFLVIIKHSGESIALTPSNRKRVLSLAVLDGCLTQTLLFSSYIFIPTGIATTFHFVYPTVVILGSVLFFRQKVQRAKIVGLLLCTVGILLFYSPGAPLNPFGCALAILSGVSYAGYILMLEYRKPEGVSTYKVSFYISLAVSLAMAVLSALTGNFVLPKSAACWLVCFVYAMFASIGGLVFFQKGTAIIGGQRTSILSAFEPITSIAVGVLLFREAFTWKHVLGTALVLSAAILIACSDAAKTGPRSPDKGALSAK